MTPSPLVGGGVGSGSSRLPVCRAAARADGSTNRCEHAAPVSSGRPAAASLVLLPNPQPLQPDRSRPNFGSRHGTWRNRGQGLFSYGARTLGPSPRSEWRSQRFAKPSDRDLSHMSIAQLIVYGIAVVLVVVAIAKRSCGFRARPNFHTLDFAQPGNPRKTSGVLCLSRIVVLNGELIRWPTRP